MIKRLEKLCTNFNVACQKLPFSVADKLLLLINYIQSMSTLRDITSTEIYYLHSLKGKREGEFALDIAGRSSGYRLIVIPLDDNEARFKKKDERQSYLSAKIIIVKEVSKHYE